MIRQAHHTMLARVLSLVPPYDVASMIRRPLAEGGRLHHRYSHRGDVLRLRGRGLHSFTSQLNLSAFPGIGAV